VTGSNNETLYQTLPAWLHIDSATGTFSGKPANGDYGNYDIRVTATDKAGQSASTTFTLYVDNKEDYPTAIGGVIDKTLREGQMWVYETKSDVYDADMLISVGEQVTYDVKRIGDNNTLLDVPAWLHINPSTGQLWSNWLLAVAGLVFLMVVVGGITRLTESGLSITEWKPVSGAIPPLSHADWQHAFDLYKQTPEYLEINGPAGMTLAQFKFIFFWEWFHRLIGRLIGVAFAFPLLWFAAKRTIPRGYGWKLVGLFVLGGMQGVLGWYMVMSGLVDRTDVSHFRLSAHLLLAFAIMSALIWVALDLRLLDRTGEDRPARVTGAAVATIAVLFIQLLFGAWVAGLNAGQVAGDWPLMQGRIFPEGVDWSNGAFFALTHDPFLIHFIHRWWAWVVVAALVIFARRIKLREGGRPASIAIHSAFGTQILLGILTVLTGVAIWLAALHQAVGALVLASTVWGAHVLGRGGK
jgi:cytochrome c oxidase assembly protein subunit 15